MRKTALLSALTLCLSAFGADLTGKWKVVIKDSGGPKIKAELNLKQEGAKLTGTVSSPQGAIALENVELNDNVLTCKLDFGGTSVAVKVTADGDKLSGAYTTSDGDSGTVEAERKAATAPSAAPAVSPVAGDWKISTTGPDGSPLKAVLSLKQDGGAWDGQLVIEDYGLTVPLAGIKVDGASFTCNVPAGDGIYAVEARVADGKLEGTATGPDGEKTKIAGAR
jgi:hypothetical protein